MRVLVNNVAILKGPRLRLICVANQVDRFFFIRLDKAPLYSAGKSGSTASAQAGCLYFVYNVEARHCHGLLELLVAAVVQISIDVGGPILAADVFENEAMLQGMGGVDVAHLGGSRENLSGLLRLHILMQAIIDHADGRRSTAGEAFNEFDAVISVCADPNRIMDPGVLVVQIDATGGGEMIAHLVTARHGAT